MFRKFSSVSVQLFRFSSGSKVAKLFSYFAFWFGSGSKVVKRLISEVILDPFIWFWYGSGFSVNSGCRNSGFRIIYQLFRIFG